MTHIEPLPFFIYYYKVLLSYNYENSRSNLEKLSQEELLDELLTVNSIDEELANITSRFDEFLEKNVRVQSELEV